VSRRCRTPGAEWTVLRASWFCQNFSESFLLGPVLSGLIALPAQEMAEPFIDADDTADVALAALTDDRHVGQLYELTGPRLLTVADAAAAIATAAGRPVRYLAISPERFTSALTDDGLPADHALALTELFTTVPTVRGTGRNAHGDRRCPPGPWPRAPPLRRLRTRRRGIGCLGDRGWARRGVIDGGIGPVRTSWVAFG